MKVANPDVPAVQMRGAHDVTNFSINVSAQAFSILSSGLYKDPIKAIIRELSTNAVDAHIAADNESTPYDVDIPTRFSPVFRIRDYGTGLDKEDVLGLYSTYFNSTKTDTNEQVGALGLGSKSPLGYTNNFSVVSYFNGVKYNFSVFLNDVGVPTIAVTGESVTDEHNGLEIIVPAKDDYSLHTWEEKAQEVYRYFDMKPNIRGSELDVSSPKYEKDVGGVKIRERIYGAPRYVIQGGIAYPLDLTMLGLDSDLREIINDFHYDIYVDIGEVSFLPNREELSYDDNTKRNINNRLKVFADKISDTVEEIINTIRTIDDAFEVMEKITTYYTNVVVYNPKLKELFGKKVKRWEKYITLEIGRYGTSTAFKVSDIQAVFQRKFPDSIKYFSGKRKHASSWNSSYAERQGRVHFWINDTKKSVVTKLGRYLKGNERNDFLINERVSKDEAQRYANLIKRRFGLTKAYISFVSDVEFPEAPKAQKKPEVFAVDKFRLISYSNSYGASENWRWERGLLADHLFDDTKVWVEKKGHSATGFFREDEIAFDSLLGGSDRDTWNVKYVYGVKSNDVDKIKNDPEWVHINDYIVSYIKKYIKTNFTKSIAYNVRGLDEVRKLNRDCSDSLDMINNAEIRTILFLVLGSSNPEYYNSDPVSSSISQWSRILGIKSLDEIGVDFDAEIVYNDGNQLTEVVETKYPLLNALSLIAGNGKSESLINIINQVYP